MKELQKKNKLEKLHLSLFHYFPARYFLFVVPLLSLQIQYMGYQITGVCWKEKEKEVVGPGVALINESCALRDEFSCLELVWEQYVDSTTNFWLVLT